jgi:hypothetical protein
MKFLVHAPAFGTPPLGSVMTPSLTRTYAGWSSRGQIYGQPGTQAIPVNDPSAVREDVNSLAAVGVFSTACAPNVIYPSLYYLVGEQEHAPVSVFSDNQMPVPARRAPNVLVAKPYRSRKGGQRQVYQPQVVQTWRGMKGTANG